MQMIQDDLTIGKSLDLKAEQDKTLSSPRLKTNLILKSMFLLMDIIYGFKRTLPKFKVIEILARYPYWAWENGAYHWLTRASCKKNYLTKEKVDHRLGHIELGRKAQDNEQWHMLILDDLIKQKGIKQGWIKFHLIPRILSLGYYYLTRLMYRVNPIWSFEMNAAFESHAEHEYMKISQENPDYNQEPVTTAYFQYYPKQSSLADLLRRIGLDERDHMHESLRAAEIHKKIN
ncbi:MAG: hypothetical protein KKA19_05000 [Candidatus Margulisbacteria bacterium]|nr:hypothetical protein [Candidatus Margulisiibacteriota bacterium]